MDGSANMNTDALEFETGISGYALQTTTNVLSLVSAMIAAGLYGNIGIKVILGMISGEFTRKTSLLCRVLANFLSAR